MSNTLLFDFSDQPQNSAKRQVISAEQAGVLCGLNRRIARRIGKTVFAILSNFPPETLFENSIWFQQAPNGPMLSFRFSTHPQDLVAASQSADKKLGSLRRAGEKCSSFELTGSPDKGFDIQLAEPLPVGFTPPSRRKQKEWARVIANGDWESAFGLLSKSYRRAIAAADQALDGMHIRNAALDGGSDQTEAILSLVASKSDNPVLILDAAGNTEWNNRAFTKLTGIKFESENKPAAAELLFGSARAKPDADKFAKSLSKGRTFSLEFSWQPAETAGDSTDESTQRPTASPIWIEFQVTPVRDENEAVVRWIAIGANITLRRQAELAMQAAKEVAESANKAKSDFLAMMSHEIRTPMNAIIGMTELTLGTQLTIDQRECLTTANNSAQSLLQILNDILDLSKVEAQRLELEQIDFNIADLTRETLDTLGVLAQRKDLALRCNFPLDVHQQLVGDSMRLRQVLVNLVGNAIKFTSFGHVEVCVEQLDETNTDTTLHYSVRDTGVGIPANKTSQIFEAFFQTDASVTRNFGGTGLGLAITSELIRLMGGRLWVESKLGKGSTFHFVVTLQKSNRNFVSLANDAGSNLAGKRILIIDDDQANRSAITHWMQHWGVESQFAETGRQGQQILQDPESQFDLAIVDVVLPDIDGFEVAASLSHSKSNSTTPILMFSSDDRTSTVERCRDLGLPSYLIKPVSPKTLLASIQLALGATGEALAGQRMPAGGLSIVKTATTLNILVVDDQASNRKLIGEVLRRRGHSWREAGDCDGAVALIQQEKFDVVLMDVQMPDKDGLQATAEIRLLPDNNAILPVIAVTAYVTEADRQRCLDASMDDYLPKPINVYDLIEKVERWGNTTRDEINTEPDDALDDQLLIQDAPDWATQITQSIVVAEENAGAHSASTSPAAAGTTAKSSDQPQPTAGHPFPLALERFGGDEALLRMQIGFFLDEVPELMQNLRSAILASDGKSLHHNAHRLKGLVRTYDDDLAAELTAKLEDMGRNNSFADAKASHAQASHAEASHAEATLVLLSERVNDLTQRLKDY